MPANLSVADKASILILRMSSLGDAVHALPTLAALRRHFPRARLGWLARPAVRDLLLGNPCLDEILVLDNSPPGNQAAARGGENGPRVISLPGLAHPLALARALRRGRYDITLDLQGLFKSGLIARLSGARRRIGYRSWQEGQFLFNNLRLVPDRKDAHAIWGYLGFAQLLGADPFPIEFPLAWLPEDEEAVASLLGEKAVPPDQALLALAPGGTWPSKRWPPENYGEVASALAREQGLRAMIVGAALDRERAARLCAVAGEAAVDLTGLTTIKQLAALLRRCALMIGNDTGPMHLAAALGVPTVAVLGPTAGERIGPWGGGNAVVTAELPCGPCRRRACPPVCGSGGRSGPVHGARCMLEVSPHQVAEAALRVLAQSPPRTRARPGEGRP